MTDPTDTTADAAAGAASPEGGEPAGDPALAALVQRDAPAVVDPSLATLLSPAAAGSIPSDPAEPTQVVANADIAGPSVAASVADTRSSTELIDTASADGSTTSELAVDVEPVHPVAAGMLEGEPPARPRRRRKLAVRFAGSFLVGLVVAVGIGAGALYAWEQQYQGRVLPGVSIGGTDLSGLTREQAEAQIANAYASLGSGAITLSGPDGHMTTISYADVGRGPDTSALVDAALAAGRHGDPLTNLISGPRAAMHGVTVDPLVAYDRGKLAAVIGTLATTLDQAPVDAFVSAGQGGKFAISPAKEGRAVDQAALATALGQQLAGLGTPASIAMDVPLAPLAPAVATASAEEAKAAADRMATDVVVTRGPNRWTIPGSKLAPLISFTTADGIITPVFDESGLDPLLERLASQVYQKRQDAGLKLVSGHIVATGGSHEGRLLDRPGMKAAVMTELGARQTGAAASDLAAAVKAVQPKLTAADAKAFAGKMKVISSFSVYYFVIINNHWGGNIEAPATKIHGTVVPAGGVFDFWKVVGDLRKLPGTGPGNAIEGGKITVTGAFGGGICTTSTTLFNAAFHAGMIPMARKNHNEYIDRYPAGLDATVWIVGNVKQTMSFLNDTKYPILISRTVSSAGNKRWLTFKIWSVPNGRKATVTNTVIQPGERAVDRTVRDSSKPVGYSYRNNYPVNGAKVWTTVSIYDHGKLHWRKRYFSNYPAVDGVRIVGTG